MTPSFSYGIHVAIAEGYDQALAHAKNVGASAIQFFSGNPRSYSTPKIDVKKLEQFATMRQEAGIHQSVIHTPYIINLASEDAKMVNNSVRLIRHDLAFAAAGKVNFVNTHLGSYGTRDHQEGFASVVAALERILEGISPDVVLVLENSAGAGNLCGGTLEELGELLRVLQHPQLAICIDTAHAWAAGYDLSSQAGVTHFSSLLAREVSGDQLAMFHFNDTQVPLGGKRDRHWHIGEGLIGLAGFRALLACAELQGKTAILETPGKDEDDMRNMQTIRTLIAELEAA